MYLGGHFFSPLFYGRLGYLVTNIAHFWVQKAVQTERDGQTQRRTDAHPNCEAPCTKTLRAIKSRRARICFQRKVVGYWSAINFAVEVIRSSHTIQKLTDVLFLKDFFLHLENIPLKYCLVSGKCVQTEKHSGGRTFLIYLPSDS